MPGPLALGASLALAISTVVTPLLFSAMKTDNASGWVLDKAFLIATRVLFATAIAVPLSFLGTLWFSVLFGVAMASFASRLSMWTLMEGDRKTYLHALVAGLFVFAVYFLLVDTSDVGPDTWTN